MTTTPPAVDERRESFRSSWGELAPAAVLPAQLTPAFRCDASQQPEKRLMLAVLEEAVAAYQKLTCATTPYGRREFLAAQSWIESDEMRWPFSFANICEALGLDSAAVRRGLRAWRDRQRALPVDRRAQIRPPSRPTNGTRPRPRGRAPGIRLVD
jgi:hypothetical protein